MQSDSEASIRTNTCILVGRLAQSLNINARRKILAPAFAKALKDGFIHARVAGLSAFLANTECFEPDEIASKVLPVVVTALVDKEKVVRDQAFKTLHAYLKKLETYVSTLPETTLTSEARHDIEQRTVSPNSLVSTAAGAAGALAGWTWSSIGKKIANGDLAGSAVVSGSIDISPPSGTVTPSLQQSAHGMVPHTSSTGAMKLPKSKTGDLSDLADELQQEEIQLIDLGTDDWGSFEVATVPTPTIGVKVPKLRSHYSSESTALQSPVIKQISDKPSSSTPLNLALASPSPGRAHSTSPAISNKSLPNIAPSSAPISKEDKLAEMARRKEERRQRIANLKQQNLANKG